LALCEVTKVLQSTKRAYDHSARWGGEEFLMLMPNCSEADLLGIAERIREGIAALQIQAGGSVLNFTVSIGAHHPTAPQTLDTMLQKVDSALYAAKDAGRNCVRLSGE
jgi:diguanylate cyclase (GGDEF)-like protein